MDPRFVSAAVLRRMVSNPARDIPVHVAALKNVPQQGRRTIVLCARLLAVAVPASVVVAGGLSLRGVKTFIAGR